MCSRMCAANAHAEDNLCSKLQGQNLVSETEKLDLALHILMNTIQTQDAFNYLKKGGRGGFKVQFVFHSLFLTFIICTGSGETRPAGSALSASWKSPF